MLKTSLAITLMIGTMGQAHAKEYVVQMLNKGDAGFMVFQPSLVKIAPGDTVRFEPTDKSHNAESILGMTPTGAVPFKGKMNQPIVVKFTTPGVYGFKCLPHYVMGMVGLVIVGRPVNLAQASAVSHPGKAKGAFAALLAKAN